MKPVIAVICDTSAQGHHIYHQAGDKYLTALRKCSDAIPVLLPSLTDTALDVEEITSFADGILFTGGYSNIQPANYGAPKAPEGELEDPSRDQNTLNWLPKVLEAGLPMLGICRGLQEMNVALGGTLYSRVHEIDGRFDHRENPADPVDIQYGPAHSVSIREGGILHSITGEQEFMVNSVHGQAIHQVAPGLMVEATADDDTIEAVSIEDSKGWNLAVQWHPEWKAWEDAQSVKIFKAFGDAARVFKAAKVV